MVRVKVLQLLEKITTGIYTGVPLMQKSAYLASKQFLRLLPKPPYHSLMHILDQCESECFIVLVKKCENHMVINLGCMQDV
jgi:hypothetical protein